ncbi:MAG: type II toxin-antitoxin system RelE/ParE family toxin [Candidatus Babeliales bacterium]
MKQRKSFEGYALELAPSAEKQLKKLETSVAKAIDEKLEDLIEGVPNLDIRKMEGADDTYRLRCGDYRVIFEVKKHIVTILVIKIAHRKEVYRD